MQANEPRIWQIQVRDVTAGHGMSLPVYSLPYYGFEMQNPPEKVVEYSAYEQLQKDRQILLDTLERLRTAGGYWQLKFIEETIAKVTR